MIRHNPEFFLLFCFLVLHYILYDFSLDNFFIHLFSIWQDSSGVKSLNQLDVVLFIVGSKIKPSSYWIYLCFYFLGETRLVLKYWMALSKPYQSNCSLKTFAFLNHLVSAPAFACYWKRRGLISAWIKLTMMINCFFEADKHLVHLSKKSLEVR